MERKIWITSLLLAIIHGLIPIVYREVKERKTEGDFKFEKTLVYTNMLTNIVFTCMNNFFLIYGVTEYSRSIIFLEQTSNLIAISRLRKFGKKKFPTINIFCKHSYHCWSLLVKLLRSYGLVYLKVYLNFSHHITLPPPLPPPILNPPLPFRALPLASSPHLSYYNFTLIFIFRE